MNDIQVPLTIPTSQFDAQMASMARRVQRQEEKTAEANRRVRELEQQALRAQRKVEGLSKKFGKAAARTSIGIGIAEFGEELGLNSFQADLAQGLILTGGNPYAIAGMLATKLTTEILKAWKDIKKESERIEKLVRDIEKKVKDEREQFVKDMEKMRAEHDKEIQKLRIESTKLRDDMYERAASALAGVAA